MPGQLGAASDRTLRARRDAQHLVVLGDTRHHVEVHVDHVQQVVEVVRDAAREPTDRLHLLHLDQRGLGPLPFSDLSHQAVVGAGQLAGARHDAFLERAVQPFDFGTRVLQLLQVEPRRVLAATRTHCGVGSSR